MMAQQEEAEQARLAERPTRPTPLSRVTDGSTPPPRLQPPAMGTWLSQADVENPQHAHQTSRSTLGSAASAAASPPSLRKKSLTGRRGAGEPDGPDYEADLVAAVDTDP